ncbi:MAG: hypothetical protein FWB74_01695 [Defluviitaleaceae bacterium]|nr:hypothetical protein [Defluviitaleaceae bacterium]
MSKNKSQNRDNTLKVAVGFLAVFTVVVAAVLIVNARSLGFIGTVDGTRIPMEQFRFQNMLDWDMLGDMAWMVDEYDVAEMTLRNLADLYIMANRADSLGISLSAEDIREAHADAQRSRANLEQMWGFDVIADIGFSNRSFNNFMEKFTLAVLVSEHIGGQFYISDEELVASFEEFVEERADDFRVPYVYFVEVPDYEEGEIIRDMLMMGADIREFMLDNLDEGATVEDVQTERLYEVFGVTFEMWEAARTSPENSLLGPMATEHGTFGVFLSTEIVLDLPEFEDWKEFELADLEQEYFQNHLAIWRNAAEITKNTRVFNRFFQMPTPDPDIDFEIVEE